MRREKRAEDQFINRLLILRWWRSQRESNPSRRIDSALGSHDSYETKLAARAGIEPASSALTGRRITLMLTRKNRSGAVRGIRTRTHSLEDWHARPLNTSTAQILKARIVKEHSGEFVFGFCERDFLSFSDPVWYRVHTLN